jgi:hypothetical protein
MSRWIGSIVVSVVLVSVANAQGPELATITTDTGAFAPGHRDFSHYDTPGLCWAAASITYANARRSLEVQAQLDTMQNLEHDTIGLAATTSVVQRCANRFFASDTAAADLPALFSMARLIRNDSLALRILGKQIAHAPTASAKLALRLDALTAFLGVTLNRRQSPKPPLMTAARSVIATLEHDTSFTVRLLTQERILRYWESRDSLPAIAKEATTLLTMLRQAPPKTFEDRNLRYTQFDAYSDLMTIALFTNPDSIKPLAIQAVRDSLYVPIPQRGLVPSYRYSLSEIIGYLVPSGRAWDPEWRKPMPALQAAFWYPKGVDTLQPVSGKVTLFVVGGGAPIASRIRHLLRQYGTQGFRVTMVESTDDTAAYWRVPKLGVDGPMTPEKRAAFAWWYYHEYEHLPVSLGVQLQHVRFPPWPLERAVVSQSSFTDLLQDHGACGDPRPGCAILASRNGMVLWSGDMSQVRPGLPWILDRLIGWALEQPQHLSANK